jgi:hypothetical protein
MIGVKGFQFSISHSGSAAGLRGMRLADRIETLGSGAPYMVAEMEMKSISIGHALHAVPDRYAMDISVQAAQVPPLRVVPPK